MKETIAGLRAHLQVEKEVGHRTSIENIEVKKQFQVKEKGTETG